MDQLEEERKVFRCAPNYVMTLGLELCIDPLCFGSNMHVGCVSLCISFIKCPRSSKLEFGAKSYSRFSAKSGAQDSSSRPCPLGLILGSEPCHLGLELGSRPCSLGPVECFYMCLEGWNPEMVRLLGLDRVQREKPYLEPLCTSRT